MVVTTLASERAAPYVRVEKAEECDVHTDDSPALTDGATDLDESSSGDEPVEWTQRAAAWLRPLQQFFVAREEVISEVMIGEEAVQQEPEPTTADLTC